MSTPFDTPTLDPCGCCETGLHEHKHHNRPGQPSLAYRLGTHGTFLRRLLASLPSQTVVLPEGEPIHPLENLTTRALDDPAIGFLDAWAIVADVLTFYQELIANEGYLLTAKERSSVLELARAIGYELNPGVAASTYLAFTLEDAEGAPQKATVPAGTRVQSVPAQSEQAQTFETAAEFEARAAWNALKPQLTARQEIARGTSELFLKGTDAQLQPGDAIVLVGEPRVGEHWDFRILQTVTPDHKKNRTRISWRTGLGHWTGAPGSEVLTVEPASDPNLFVFRQRAALFGYNAPQWAAMPLPIRKAYNNTETDPPNVNHDWPANKFRIRQGNDLDINLDAVYPEILKGSWVVLKKPTYAELYKVADRSFSSRQDFTLSAKTTLLTLDSDEDNHLDWFGLRDTVVWAQSEQLELAESPCTEPVFGSTIRLDEAAPGLTKAQPLVFSGKATRRVKVGKRTEIIKVGNTERERVADPLVLRPADGPQLELGAGDLLDVTKPPTLLPDVRIRWYLKDSDGQEGSVDADPGDLIPEPPAEDAGAVSEVAFLDKTPDGDERTLRLSAPLKNTYDRASLSINANVASATHGEKVREPMGTGDGAQTNQRFTLKNAPLTYVSASTPSGGETTLQVRVNEVLWKEVPSLYQRDESSQSYIVRIADDGKPDVIFGDGQHGALLPTGATIHGVYRSGIGLDGEVAAGSLTTLQDRPPGLKEVTNPLKASGAQGPEKLEQTKENAPLTVRTLDRIVSLQDFEDFARAFAGIGKAQAIALWHGDTRLVHITIAGASGKEIRTDSDTHAKLVEAMDKVRDPTQSVQVDSFERITFAVVAKVLVDARYRFDDVQAAVQSALKDAFTFEERSIGEPVTAVEVVTLIQKVAGVVAVDLDDLHRASDASGVRQFLFAERAHWDDTGAFQPGQLFVLEPAGIEVLEMRA